MRVTASQIVDWVNTHAKEAQIHLPRWVRRLCFDPEATRQLSFPAGDSTYVPGWDGVLSNERGNAWIPQGASRWEIGCDQDIVGKANGDYLKRTGKTSEEERSTCTFVFVTPRRWMKKSDWIAEQRAKKEWADVRAYDADDLEQWLEQVPAVALQFAEELGLSGLGVITLSRYWNSWSLQCKPAITADALFMDRAPVRDAFVQKLQAVGSQENFSQPLVIRADSVEEAVAFAVAVVLSSGNLQDQALVVTEPQGWRYVDANPQLRIVVAARTETASTPVLREGLMVIVPHATGDVAGNPKGSELILDRPNIYEFEKALIAIGMEESDAKRYALSTGRSWTVFRRQRATNPAIQSPEWMNRPQAVSLTLLCLLGAWHADNEADRFVVERLAARPYEEIEQDLRQLARLDDAPLLSIGSVWKAKSPLELLSQFGDRITSGQLDRFFMIATEMLAATDPQLELPEEERWMAQVRGKVHSHSGLLFESICDSLMKLAVRGSEQAGLQTLDIEDRVARLVHQLLDEADESRWLSLASYLPTLAEAAPDTFLRAVEKSLRLLGAPVTRLITETSSSGFAGRCWHAGLLWALETLAWAPNRLGRVALILARLSHVPMKGNWGNKPERSLFGLFRSWLPQTAASLPERIKVLNLLIQKDEDAAVEVLEAQLKGGQQSANFAHRPKWRDDDAAAGYGVAMHERNEMLSVAKEKLLKLSEGNASRIASLLKNTILRSKGELSFVLPMIESFSQPSTTDEDREILRAALGKIIHWHRNYDETPAIELDEWLLPVEACYERLAPQELVARHRWLFDSHWVELPGRERDEDIEERNHVLAQHRISALDEIHLTQGMAGIEKLIAVCAEPGTVGLTLTQVAWDGVSWHEWIATKGENFVVGAHMSWCVSGFLHALSLDIESDFLQKVIALGTQLGWDSAKTARFLILCRLGPLTWRLAETCGAEVDSAYWQGVRPYSSRDDEHLDFVMERLLEVKRPKTALQYCQYALVKIRPAQLFSALQQLLLGEEADGPRVESWHMEKMIERLEKSGEIEKMALIQLEFGLFPLLGHGQEAKANVLYEGIMSEPELFKELICMLYKPEHRERDEPVTEASQAAAERAWDILHHCKRLPGTRAEGGIDDKAFTHYIDATRALCCDADRQTMCDQTLGQILAYSPADEDGTWPFTPAREVLDRPELEEMRRGFCIGTWNKRGVTSRSPWDGGEQERDLASYYRKQAMRVQSDYPNVAAMLDEIAKDYDRHGKREDAQANLRKEGF